MATLLQVAIIQVLTAVLLNLQVHWDVTLSGLLDSEDADTISLLNVGSYLPADMV
jgi:hypothetical protein